MRPRWRRNGLVLGVAAAGLAIALSTSAFVVPPADPVRTAVRIPDAHDVVARVDPAPPAPLTADLPTALRVARTEIERSRREADPRYLGRAQAVLAPWWRLASPPDAVLLLRATIRQALHDFVGARADLDVLIARSPDDVQARLTRAVVATVTGDVAQATADCAAIAPSAGELVAASCAAPLAWLSGDAPAAARRLDAAIAARPVVPATVTAWARAAAGDLARQLGDDAAAELHLRAALAAVPGDAYALAGLADLLLDRGRPAEVVRLLGDHAGADNLLLRLAIAERATGAPAAAEHAALLRERFAALLARGDRTHLREHARFALAIDLDARTALALAVAGWELQKEPADARIVLEAARAAHQPSAAAGVRAWLTAHDAQDATLEVLR